MSQPLPLASGARNAIFKDLPNSKLRRTVLGTVLFSAFYASLLRCLRSRVLFAARFAMIRVTAGCGAHNFCLVHHRDWISCELAQRRLARCPECRVQIQQDPAALVVNVGIRGGYPGRARALSAQSRSDRASHQLERAVAVGPPHRQRLVWGGPVQWRESCLYM